MKLQEWGYINVLKACNINTRKITHCGRVSGMMEASKEGQHDDSLGSMSKHVTSKMNRYIPELNSEVMKCMAGCGKEEEYYIPRVEVGFPEWTNLEDIMTRIFPSIIRWRAEQSACAFGDRSEAARNFLNKLVLFLAKVIFQDGIYWIKKYPQHKVSVLL
jgi:hypothetical protein